MRKENPTEILTDISRQLIQTLFPSERRSMSVLQIVIYLMKDQRIFFD
jgi:hypothetical protein